jgi:EAL domain-containing protein (putative c-di-GMP-specific phosphodiesterase class I)
MGAVWFLCGRQTDGEPPRYVPIYTSPFLVGRKASCALPLACSAVSNVHAELRDDGVKLTVRDLRSTNGTYVNGQRIAGEVDLVSGDLVQFGKIVFRVVRQAPSLSNATAAEEVCDEAMSLVLFDRLMTARAVVPHYHAIVDLGNGQVHAWEVLVRSQVPGLETPASMFSAASQLNLEVQLSHMIRVAAVTETRQYAARPHLFLNTHPTELRGTELIGNVAVLRELLPDLPLTIEIHEAAVSDLSHMGLVIEELRRLGVRVAFDDFGAGQSRLIELAAVRPEYLKFDMSMTRALRGHDPDAAKMVYALVEMVRRMGIASVAEGVEEEQDAAACVEAGFDLAQGFYFGKPGLLHAHGADR